ncbi:YihY/virulence factor BrkB family protein [Patulibacter sp. SYSU D01012]|uniref:YihY/virulence factor BrkB family protein n=1 Tax=Patulibacter sp. SYSU D01012 TaxID=2817381 RepID=UPI001B3148C8|nr:YihY/virulence factor BrkB family protein [Patulibacter sp. SYSU D01012]
MAAPEERRPPRLRPLRDEALPPGSWRGIAIRAFRQFQAQGMQDWAGTLAYNSIRALVPVLLVAAALLTLLGASSLPSTIADQFADVVSDRTSSSTASQSADAVRGLVQTALDQAKGGASITLVISVVLAINGASGAFSAAGRALNVVHHVPETRSFVRHKLADVLTALLVIGLMAVAALLFVLGGGVADDVFGWLGLGDAPIVWQILRIPIGLLALLLGIGIIYARAPDLHENSLRLLAPGALTALIAWLLATVVFALYVRIAGFGSAYGALGGAIVLLFWLWLSAAAFLFGAEVEAEVARTRLVRGEGPPAAMGAGVPPVLDDDEDGATDPAEASDAAPRAPRRAAPDEPRAAGDRGA